MENTAKILIICHQCRCYLFTFHLNDFWLKTLLNLHIYPILDILEAKRKKSALTYRLSKNTHIPLTYLAGHDGGKVLLFVHKHQVLKRSWLEEKGVSFFQRHGRRKLWFVVIITQVGYLIQITNTEIGC